VKRYAMLMLLVLGLSACTIRFDIGMDVKEDESGSFAVFIGLDEEMRDLMSQFGGEDVSLMDQFTGEIPEGFDVEEYSEDGFEGVRLSATFNSIDELNSKLAASGSDQGGAVGTDLVSNFSLTHDGDEFRFQADLTGVDQTLTDAIGEAGGEELMPGFGPDALSEVFDARFRLTLPGTIQDNNADSVNGNTLTWNIVVGDTRDALQAVSSTAGGTSPLLIGGVAVVAAALIGGGVAVSRRKKKSAVDAINSTPAGPVS
jgi:hypothetical protein